MDFKEQIKQNAIINVEKATDTDALEKLEMLKANGTLDRYYVQLKELLVPILNDHNLLVKLLKQAMLSEVYIENGNYVLHLKTGGSYRTVFGTIKVEKGIPTEMLKINSVFENAKYTEPLPRKRTQALKEYFEICKQDNADTFFPRNVITGYLDTEGKLRVSSNIATWTKETILDVLDQLKENENIVGKYDGEEIIFELD